MFRRLYKKYLVWRLNKFKAVERERGYLNSGEAAKMLQLRDELYTLTIGRGILTCEGATYGNGGKSMDIINEDQIEVLPSYYDETGKQRWMD